MRSASLLTCLAGLLISNAFATTIPSKLEKRQNYTTPTNASSTIEPKIMIVSMFDPEAEVWYGIPEFDLLAQNISLPGLSPLFPAVHCTADGEICQVVIGEGGILLQHIFCARSRC